MHSFLLGDRPQPFGRRAYFGTVFEKTDFPHCIVLLSIGVINGNTLGHQFLITVFPSHKFINKGIAPLDNPSNFLYLLFLHFLVQHLLVLGVLGAP